ncbi:MAG: hypothetical protein COV47_04840 [Candidatus Diapherotrites archaeon CG11_big_fil_rev_8_21_14_0_20_37_9]|nr:MAG: hypothetical protein COV47_04840 [Candidatus Diapherotrites archaeon CG11_big_fil_rev_8_21_14_0_20_37_9]
MPSKRPKATQKEIAEHQRLQTEVHKVRRLKRTSIGMFVESAEKFLRIMNTEACLGIFQRRIRTCIHLMRQENLVERATGQKGKNEITNLNLCQIE